MKKGFTLVEILAVIVIIAVVGAIGGYVITGTVNKSKEKSLDETAVSVKDAADTYIAGNRVTWNEGNLDLNMTPGSGDYDELLELGKDPWGNNYDYVIARATKEADNTISIKVYIGAGGKHYILNSNNELEEDPLQMGLNILNGTAIASTITPPPLSGMIPISYVNNKWVKADSNNVNNTWFSYEDKKWANAVSVTNASRVSYNNAAIGTEILESNILAYFVWIPRYEYRINSLSLANTVNPVAININLIAATKVTPTAGYAINNAFNFGNQQLSGFWYGKFETSADPVLSENCYKSAYTITGPLYFPISGANCNNGNITPRIKPSRGALVFQDVQYQFKTALKFTGKTMADSGAPFTVSGAGTNDYGLSGDSHMSKNSEWGAVAYLAQSEYGRCSSSTNCSRINSNLYYGKYFDPGASFPNVTGITGCGSSVSVGAPKSDGFMPGDMYYRPYEGWTTETITFNACVDETNSPGVSDTYETVNGQSASTTGNITGIYDMVGGTAESVMANYNDYLLSYPTAMANVGAGYSGFDQTFYPPSKYIDYYYSIFSTNCGWVGHNCQGHGLSETQGWYNMVFADFYPDEYMSYTWMIRDESAYVDFGGGYMGAFAVNSFMGNFTQGTSFRVTLIP